MRTHTRRDLLGLALVTTAAPGALHAFSWDERDPTDRVPGRYSVRRFLMLSKEDVYMVNLAVRRGRRILITGYTASQSKEIIMLAAKDLAAAHALLKK